jgi:hypothetical protein
MTRSACPEPAERVTSCQSKRRRRHSFHWALGVGRWMWMFRSRALA